MKSELRMLILTDYIRKEFKTIIGNPDAEVKSIGVVPIFEMLRREVAPDCRLGVLCGSMIILPVTALPCLEAFCGEAPKTAVCLPGSSQTGKAIRRDMPR